MKENMFNWVEIPVSDFDRARSFYQQMLDVQLDENQFGEWKMGFFPGYQGEGVSGAIVAGAGYEPTSKGTLVYFNANPDLQLMLNRVKKAGGKILQEKKQISEEYGYMALLQDSEGNRIALHSRS